MAGVIKAWRAFQMAWQLLCDIETETEKSVRTTTHKHSGTKPEPANINYLLPSSHTLPLTTGPTG